MQVGSSKVQIYTKGAETKTSILEFVVMVVNPMLSKTFNLAISLSLSGPLATIE
jgi:hypothetical protein